jgi:hypothetical protein
MLPATPTSTGYTITVYPGQYSENLTLGNKNVIIQGSQSQNETYNTWIEGNHTITVNNASGAIRTFNTVEFRDIQMTSIINSITPMIMCDSSAMGTYKGTLFLKNVKFGESATGSGINWITSNANTDFFIIATNCRWINGGTQSFSQSACLINGTTTLTIYDSYIEVNLENLNIPMIEMIGTGALTVANNEFISSVVNPNAMISLKSSSNPNHLIQKNVFSGGQVSAVMLKDSGQQLIFIYNYCSLTATYLIDVLAGAQTIPTILYYFHNGCMPGTATQFNRNGTLDITYTPLTDAIPAS